MDRVLIIAIGRVRNSNKLKKKLITQGKITRTRGKATVFKTQFRRVNTEKYKQNKIGVNRRYYEW